MIAPVDRTTEFCEAIRVAASKSAAHPKGQSGGDSSKSAEDASFLMTGPVLVTNAFTIESCELDRKILGMKLELESQSRRYCDFSGRGMADGARDELDSSATAFLRACMAQIDVLKSEAVVSLSRGGGGSSFAAHKLGCVAILNDHLGEVSSAAERLRTARVRAAVAAASSASTAAAVVAARGGAAVAEHRAARGQRAAPGTEERAEAEAEAAEMAYYEQEFARENAALVSELVERRERVREAERTVAEIASLNQLFAAKVLEQAREIETLYELAVEATTYVDRGNRELRKMKGKGPMLKFWVAFTILVLSFAMLFLDWMSRRRALFWIF